MNIEQTAATVGLSADIRNLATANDVIRDMRLSPATGRTGSFDVEDPATGEVVATLADFAPEEGLAAVVRADAAGVDWAGAPSRIRADVLHAWYDLLILNRHAIAMLISREMGKPLSEAYAEVSYGTDFVRWYAEEAIRPQGDFRDVPSGGATLLVRRAPVGLSVLLTPWNFPLAMATRKIAPALASGCPVVIKPAELTPLTTVFVVRLAVQAGVPEDLIQVVTTTNPAGFSELVLRDPRVRKVSFTGSTPVGRHLLAIASQQVLRTSMELGGNAPLLVFDDADLDRAVAGAYAAKIRNGGQSCIAANRIYVQDGIADDFVDALTAKMAETVVGHGLSSHQVGLGPLITQSAVQRSRHLVADALAHGAELRTGGNAAGPEDRFFLPTLLDRVPATAEAAQTEIFGPIAAVQRFSTQDEAIVRANATEFGLASYVFTQDLDRALNVADHLQSGLVGINQGVPSNAAAPFGGVKHSGLGREGSAEGIEEYQSIRFYNVARRETS